MGARKQNGERLKGRNARQSKTQQHSSNVRLEAEAERGRKMSQGEAEGCRAKRQANEARGVKPGW